MAVKYYRNSERARRPLGLPDDARPWCPCHERPTDGSVKGWHVRKGPLPVLNALHRLQPSSRARWVDHAYRLRLDDGRWCYVAEPYDLDADALADLAYLGGAGFEVDVSAERARHNPGHTLAVEITRETA